MSLACLLTLLAEHGGTAIRGNFPVGNSIAGAVNRMLATVLSHSVCLAEALEPKPCLHRTQTRGKTEMRVNLGSGGGHMRPEQLCTQREPALNAFRKTPILNLH